MARPSHSAAEGRTGWETLRRRLSAGFLLAMLTVSLAWAAPAAASALQRIDTAILELPEGERSVQLPHGVASAHVDPSGNLLRFRLQVELPEAPVQPLAIFIPKLSLAGELRLNGAHIGSCRPGPIERLRCLHQPQLFVPPMTLWTPGSNRIDIDLWVTPRQANGLSTVTVGPADALYRGPYLLQRLLQVTLVHGLTWVVLSLGVLALTVSLILRREPLYLWFGLCAVFNALSNLNVLVSYPQIHPDLYNWFVFSSRMVTAPLFILLLLEFFERAGPWSRRLLLLYALAMPIVTGISGNDRWIVLAAYLPIGAVAILVGVAMLVWSWRARRPTQILITCAAWILMAVSVEDMLRLGGRSQFEGVYLITYVLSGIFLIFGILLISRLASSLSAERHLVLRTRLASRAAAAAFWDWDSRTDTLTWATDPPPALAGDSARKHPDQTAWQRWIEAIHPADRTDVEATLRRAADGRPSLSMTYRLRDPDTGEERWWESHGLAEPAETGGRARFAGINIDVTERKQAELDLKRLIREREALMQEIHDGFGAELATARVRLAHSTLTQEELETLLGECLDDLRLVVDTLDNLDNDLLSALANYRYRLQTRLGDAPYTLTWTLPDREVTGIGSRTILQILRILQEALTNAIRHAGATRIGITLDVEPGAGLTLSVTDNGHGFNGQPRTGRGLPSMRARARAIGAHLEIQSTTDGTMLRLVVPGPRE